MSPLARMLATSGYTSAGSGGLYWKKGGNLSLELDFGLFCSPRIGPTEMLVSWGHVRSVGTVAT
jgi:hypothetical protein